MNSSAIPDSIASIFSKQVQENLCKDPANARGLPNEAFTTVDFANLEQERLFPRCWNFAGRVGSVPNSGDRVTVDISGKPYFMVRDDQNQVRVFHNVCPHRGSRIVPCDDGGSSTVTCPYHSWTFNLDGSLSARPHFHGPDKHDTQPNSDNPPHLFEVRSARWFDWVFINPDGKAEPFEKFAGPAMASLAQYPLDEFTFDAVESFEFDCNWKLVAENWIDMYHIFRVHPDLNSFMEPNSRGGMECDNAFIYRQYTMTRPSRAKGLVSANGTDNVQGLVTFGLLFPAVGITVDATNVLFATFTPLAANRSRMDMYFYFPRQVTESNDYAEARQTYRNWWVDLNGEDEEACRLLQLGRNSPAYDGGRFAPYWDSATLHYHRSILDTIVSDQ